MLSEFISFILSILGLIFLLLYVVFKTLSYRADSITMAVPLKKADKKIYDKIYVLVSILDFFGYKKASTIVIVNYDAPNWFIHEINEYYKSYNFIKIIDCCDNASKLF